MQWWGTPMPPCFSTQHPPMMQPARKLFWKALLHKEKCSAADSAGALRQSTALAVASAERLTPPPARLGLGGFLVHPMGCPWGQHCWCAVLSLTQALGDEERALHID